MNHGHTETASTHYPDAVAQWNEAVQDETAAGKSPLKAVHAANKRYPGLRLAMLKQINGGGC